jgi:putative hydrolase of HD superfamily
MSIISMTLPSSLAIDKQRCINMSIVHDMMEALAGDISPGMKMFVEKNINFRSKEDKHALERKAMEEMEMLIDDETSRREIKGLWEEYEANETPEALMVKDLDKFEMILQAKEYKKRQPGKSSFINSTELDLSTFFESTRGKFTTEYVKKLVKELEEEA